MLNPEQQNIVGSTEGIRLVVSGPGTGKTTTVTHFLVEIINQKKALPEEILAVTFTNKAADEMKKRVKEMTGENPYVSTIHYFAARVMREFPARGYRPEFTILDDKEQFRLIAGMTNRLGLEKHPHEVSEKLTLARNLRDWSILKQEGLEDFYQKYLNRLRQQQYIDFDGLLTWCLDTFNKNPEALRSFYHRFKYVLVDEFQDISPLQYAIIKLLVDEQGNLLCVGDFDQGIYSFRGADINIMLNLKQDFPTLNTYYLERNYRSTQKIVRAANQLIRYNVKREDKPHWTEREEGEDIEVKPFRNAGEEARYIASRIKKETKKGKNMGDFAVIYRINTLSQNLESTFSAEGIPYLVMGGPGFFQRAEIQDVLSFFKLIVDPADNFSIKRAESVLTKVNGGSLKLSELINNLSSRPTLLEMYRVLMYMTGHLNYLKKDKSAIGERKADNVAYLEDVIEGFSKKSNCLHEFLMFVEGTGPAREYYDSVKLLTIHSVKGLEFDTVFLVGATEDMLPHYRSTTPEELEEERRLFYVAVTRAKNRLLITYPESKKRRNNSRKERPSPFIDELGKTKNKRLLR